MSSIISADKFFAEETPPANLKDVENGTPERVFAFDRVEPT